MSHPGSVLHTYRDTKLLIGVIELEICVTYQLINPLFHHLISYLSVRYERFLKDCCLAALCATFINQKSVHESDVDVRDLA